MVIDSNRISIKFPNGNYDRQSQNLEEHNTIMFKDDLRQNIVPIYSGEESVFSDLTPVNDELKEKLTQLLPSYRNKWNSTFSDTILESIDYIVRNIVEKGYLVLEFVVQKDINDDLYYSLEPVFGKLKFESINIIQYIASDVKDTLNLRESFIAIPRDKCYIFDIPELLGGRNGYLEFIKSFQNFASQSPMSNFLSNPLRSEKTYNIQEHQKIHEIELWKMSRKYSWHHRSVNSNYSKFSSYYKILRLLEFKKNRVILRDHIIEQLRFVIKDFSRKIHLPESDLIIQGLVQLDEIEKAIEMWKSGEFTANMFHEMNLNSI